MGADVAEHSAAAKRVYSTADAILGMELTTLSFEGPADTLTETCNAQPAIFTASAACLAAYLEACGAETVSGLPDALQPALVAGHSIGELTALYAAEALTLEDGLRLVQARGELMQRAVADSPGGMAAVIGVSPQVVMQLCARARSTDSASVVSIATFNTPQQVVIAGDNSALDRAIALLKEHGARRVIPLKGERRFSYRCDGLRAGRVESCGGGGPNHAAENTNCGERNGQYRNDCGRIAPRVNCATCVSRTLGSDNRHSSAQKS